MYFFIFAFIAPNNLRDSVCVYYKCWLNESIKWILLKHELKQRQKSIWLLFKHNLYHGLYCHWVFIIGLQSCPRILLWQRRWTGERGSLEPPQVQKHLPILSSSEPWVWTRVPSHNLLWPSRWQTRLVSLVRLPSHGFPKCTEWENKLLTLSLSRYTALSLWTHPAWWHQDCVSR